MKKLSDLFISSLGASAIALGLFNSTVQAADQPKQTFVEICLNPTAILDKVLECKITLPDLKSELSFSLDHGVKILVKSRGDFGSKNATYDVKKITHLHPELTSVGAVDESIRFQATSFFHSGFITMTIPCHQTVEALLGISQPGDLGVPDPMMAICDLK